MREQTKENNTVDGRAAARASYEIIADLVKWDTACLLFTLTALRDGVEFVQSDEYKPDKVSDWRPAAEKIKKALDL